MSAGSIVMDIGKDFVAKIRKDDQLAKNMTSPPLTRIPKMAENTIVIEEEVIDVKKQCSGNGRQAIRCIRDRQSGGGEMGRRVGDQGQ